MRFTFLIIIVLITISGCYYDHTDLVYPQNNACSTGTITYSATVVGILSANCYNCHSGSGSSGGGIVLDSYTRLKTYVSNGQLINSISHTGGIPAMPLTGPALSACDISEIQTWINNGAPNN